MAAFLLPKSPTAQSRSRSARLALECFVAVHVCRTMVTRSNVTYSLL